MVICTVLLSTSIFFLASYHYDTLIYTGIRLLKINTCSGGDLPDQTPEVFFYEMLHPQDEDHNTSQEEYPETLLSRVQDILKSNSGNDFMKIREKGHPVKNFGVSMLHQLHCLEMLKNIIENGGEAQHGGHSHGGRSYPEAKQRDDLDEIKLADGADHATHCLEYIAQVGAPPTSLFL